MGIKKGAKLAGKLAGAVAKRTPLGSVASLAIGGVKALGGLRGKATKRKSRFSISRYANRLMKAKLNAKIQKVKFSALRGL